MKQQALPKQQGFLTSVDEQNKITVNKPEKWAKKSPLGSGQNNRGTTGFLHNRVLQIYTGTSLSLDGFKIPNPMYGFVIVR
ncbi:hypothetical protein GA565_06425 [Rouxiella sp. S1S-2]|uniref:hypothetical protein n=1 Tax=Rouxiella sp. S1S-2 TaxID=2653856 RepID=UPI00126576FD|nr:hypothetical protein [Rouxiella sp. S1S-2]KAB7895650.1 hypothetical protein GA565_06425 [Rouxiella sp. S1S-2]